MILINVPNSPWSESRMSLGGIYYRFVFRYNSVDERWRMDIYLSDGTPVIEGVKIMGENESLLGRYILDNFDHGDIFCMRAKNDGLPAGRYNLGIGLSYELVYTPYSELYPNG